MFEFVLCFELRVVNILFYLNMLYYLFLYNFSEIVFFLGYYIGLVIREFNKFRNKRLNVIVVIFIDGRIDFLNKIRKYVKSGGI